MAAARTNATRSTGARTPHASAFRAGRQERRRSGAPTGQGRATQSGSSRIDYRFAAVVRCSAVPWLVALAFFIAQIGSTAITGVVRDPAGAAIGQATVVATELETHAVRTAVASGDGVYTVVALPPGEYRLDVSAPGFRTVTHGRIRLETGETRRLDVDLALGAVQERVAVSADAPILRAARAGPG